MLSEETLEKILREAYKPVYSMLVERSLAFYMVFQSKLEGIPGGEADSLLEASIQNLSKNLEAAFGAVKPSDVADAIDKALSSREKEEEEK